MKTAQRAIKKGLEKQVRTFLKENPQIEKALEVFNLTSKDYANAMTSLSRKPASISFKSTHGDLGGNS